MMTDLPHKIVECAGMPRCCLSTRKGTKGRHMGDPRRLEAGTSPTRATSVFVPNVKLIRGLHLYIGDPHRRYHHAR